MKFRSISTTTAPDPRRQQDGHPRLAILATAVMDDGSCWQRWSIEGSDWEQVDPPVKPATDTLSKPADTALKPKRRPRR